MGDGANSSSLDLSAAANLVRLRAMLQRAETDAGSLTELSRHIAIVTLDAAVENAMRISAHQRGLALRPEASFHDSLNKLTSSGLPPRPDGIRGVLELHASRNLVQHVGILPDASRLPGWAADARAYVGGLIRAAFTVELDEVLLADAIRDDHLRDLLRRAETARDAGDVVAAFMHADSAFQTARHRWRERRQEIRPGVYRSSHRLLTDPDPTSPEGVLDHQEVQTFASDMAAYTRLLTTRRHLQTGGPEPDSHEVAPVLAFVYDWILRWELFKAGYPSERYAEYWTGLGPPSDGGAPSVAWAWPPQRRPGRPGEREAYDVLVQLRNLPDDGRGQWGVDLPAALDQAQDEAEVDRQSIVQQSPLSLGSTLLLVAGDLEAAVLAGVLDRAITLATEWFHERDASRAQAMRRASQLQDELRRALADLIKHGGVYGAASVLPDLTPQGPAFRVRMPLISSTPQDVNHAHGGFVASGRGLADAWIEGDDVTFPITTLDDALIAQIRQVTADTQATIQRHRRSDAEAEVRRQDYARQLAAHLGEPPQPEG